MRLQDFTFGENYPERMIRAVSFENFNGLVYSDVEIPIWNIINGGSSLQTLPLDEAPVDRPGIGGSNPWLFCESQVCCKLLY